MGRLATDMERITSCIAEEERMDTQMPEEERVDSWIALFGDQLMRISNFQGEKYLRCDRTRESSVVKADCVGIYFSAHWCPPCRGFTPQLAEIYRNLKAAGKKFEVVFVSSDQDHSGFHDYFAEMPWLALPYENREKKQELSDKFGVSGIPTLILLNPDGSTITQDGRSMVVSDPRGGWIPQSKPLQTLFTDASMDQRLEQDVNRVELGHTADALSTALRQLGVGDFEAQFREELGVNEVLDLKFVEASDLDEIGVDIRCQNRFFLSRAKMPK